MALSLILFSFKENSFCEYNLKNASKKIEREGRFLLSHIQKIDFKDFESFDNLKNITFAFVDDKLIYWNNNYIPPEFIYDMEIKNDFGLTHNLTGWYLYTSAKRNDTTIYLLKKIKAEYQVNNYFLNNSESFINCENTIFSNSEEETGINIYNLSGDFLLNLSQTDHTETNSHFDDYLKLLYIIITALLIVIFILNVFLFVTRKKIIYIVISFLATATIIAINYFTLLFVNNFNIYYSIISILFSIALLSTTPVLKFLPQKKTIALHPLFIILITIFFFLCSWIMHNLLSSDFAKSTEFSVVTYFSSTITFLLIIIINASMFVFIRSIFNNGAKINIPWYISFFLVLLTSFGFYTITNLNTLVFIYTCTFSLLILFLYEIRKIFIRNKFLNYFFITLLLSLLTSAIYNISSNSQTKEIHKTIAETISICDDEILEKEISFKNPKIQTDNLIVTEIFDSVSTPENDIYISEYITDKYLDRLKLNYEIQITICRENELIEIQPEGDIFNCIEYFNSIVEDFAIETIDSVLYNVKTNTESLYYIYRIDYTNPELPEEQASVFIEFISSNIPEGLGYPELLIDSRANKINLSGFSIANYSNSNLIYKFGDYDYTTTIPESFFTNRNNFLEENNYIHYSIKNSDGIYVIVSKPKQTFSTKTFVFSITFLIFTFLSAIFFIIFRFNKVKSTFTQSFSTRLQIFIITTLTISFSILAFFTLLYIDQKNRQTIENQLTERTNSVLIELQHKLDNINSLNQTEPEVLHNLLRKFSLVFFSDINLYNTDGRLIATSRPEIFDNYLQSDLINREAYNAIYNDNKLHFITNEKIGTLRYFSSYSPLLLNDPEPAGIINLPYFARQSEINRSFFKMISYIINIYVIIGILGTILAILFSGYLIRPLRILQQKMSKVRIDKKNEQFNWKRKDEIGALIHEYNKMVQKLEQSADLIKKNERESAWRENAQQIAHEIKNPLTPMRLNVQYLEKSYKNNDPDFASKLDQVSNSLIKQIEVLNNVAEDFSNMSKAKNRKMEKIDLQKVIETSVSTFDKRKNISITTLYLPDSDVFFVCGFEKDLLRVFNNLIKNAMQALSANENGKISILTIKDGKFIKVTVSDNGKGIPEEMQNKIFQPYFTTKSSGTGLGLAIVKTIMNEIGGEITYESTIDKGTIFTLQFLTK